MKIFFRLGKFVSSKLDLSFAIQLLKSLSKFLRTNRRGRAIGRETVKIPYKQE